MSPLPRAEGPTDSLASAGPHLAHFAYGGSTSSQASVQALAERDDLENVMQDIND